MTESSKQRPLKWRSIKTLPDNEFVLLGVWVQHNQEPEPHQEVYVCMYDAMDDQMLDQSYDCSLPWEKDDFDFWMPLPKMPKVKDE